MQAIIGFQTGFPAQDNTVPGPATGFCGIIKLKIINNGAGQKFRCRGTRSRLVSRRIKRPNQIIKSFHKSANKKKVRLGMTLSELVRADNTFLIKSVHTNGDWERETSS